MDEFGRFGRPGRTAQGVMMPPDAQSVMGADVPPAAAPVIGEEQLNRLMLVLNKYKSGKAKTDQRIIAAENWWKLRNSMEESRDFATAGEWQNFRSNSAWLHNVITNKHADAMEAYPQPVIRPREKDDREEAQRLSAILPCILEANGFEETYDEVQSSKLKFGTGIYKVVWDKEKLNGLGDISITRVNPLNVFTEPGIEDIQKSRYFFHTELVEKEVLLEMYPELEGKHLANTFLSSKFQYDDAIGTEDKATVVECYYHKRSGGKNLLHYVKFVGNHVIYATENDTMPRGNGKPTPAEAGLYDHGLYPYVYDVCFKIEGSPYGYGYVDICRNPQTAIDLLDTSFVKNSMAGAVPRVFSRDNGGVNEAEYLDLTKTVVHCSGNLGENDIRDIPHSPLDSVYVSYYDRKISELRETSGNTETATGSVSSGVTAASAIAALQEASGKGSRDNNRGSYRSFNRVVGLCIECVRQFYDMPRQFRIIGRYGAEQFITYTNGALAPQYQGQYMDMDLGYRLPVFDIKAEAQKKNVYTTVTQNELALQFFQLGFFLPQNVDVALMTMDMMDFDGKDELMSKLSQSGTMFQRLVQYQQMALMLAQKYEPALVQGLSQDIMAGMGSGSAGGTGDTVSMPETENLSGPEGEPAIVRNARERSNNAAAPSGGVVTGRARG